MNTIKKVFEKFKKHWIVYTLLAIIVFVLGFSVFSKYYLRRLIDNALEKGATSANQVYVRTSYIIPQPGEVVIHFKTTLSIEDINTFLSKNNLEAIPASMLLNIVLQSSVFPNTQEQLQADIEKLKAKNIIESCQETKQLLPVPNIFCLPNLKIPLKELNSYWISEMSLSITPSSNPLATYVIKVPIGQENDLVTKLIKLPEVQSAIAPK